MTAKLSNRTTRCPWILSPGDTKAIRFDSIQTRAVGGLLFRTINES